MIQNPAIVLCERVLSDMIEPATSGHGLHADDLLEPAEDHYGTIQTFATRIAMAPWSGDSDDVPEIQESRGITLAEGLANVAAHVWGVAAGEAVTAACERAAMLGNRRYGMGPTVAERGIW